MDGSRYSYELLDIIIEVINYLLEKNTIFPEQMILNSRYDIDLKIATLEDEVVDYHVRGKFIDSFNENINIDSYCNWLNIVAINWE